MSIRTTLVWFSILCLIALYGIHCNPSDVISMEEAQAEFMLRCERKACFCGVDKEICASLGFFDFQHNSEVFRLDLVDCIYEFDIQVCSDFGTAIPEACLNMHQR